MKMKSKSMWMKAFLLLVIGALLIGVAGCGNSNNSASSNSGTNSGSSAKKGAPVTLTWWLIGQAPKDLNQVLAKLNPILEKKINAKLDLKFADYSNYTKKMNVIISSGTPYDIAFTCSWANNFNQQATKGAYISLNDLLEKYGQGLKKLIPTDMWNAATINGKIYGVPTYKDSGNGVFFVYPKKLIDQSHFDYKHATTFQSLKPYLEYVKKNDPGVTPMPLDNGGDPGLFYPFDQVMGASMPIAIALNDPSAKVINPYTTSTMMSMLKTLHQYYKAGYINKDAATAKSLPKTKPVSLAGGWPAAAQIWSAQDGYPVVVHQAYPLYMTTSSIQGSMNAISVNSKHPVAAMKLLNLVNTDSQVRNMLAYGIEGVNYKKTGNTSIKQLNQNYAPANFAIGTFFDSMYTVDPAPKNEWTDLKKFESTAKPSPVLGFQVNTSSSKMQTQIALITNVYSKYAAEITTGTADPTKVVPEMNAALNKAGLQKLITEVQQQVDNWKKSK